MKKLLLGLFSVTLVTACQKDATTHQQQRIITTVAVKNNASKISICHHDVTTNTWQTITISIAAWPDHAGHGDVRLDDQDNDGYVPTNKCGYGQMGDCDDNNAAIHPGATEIIGDGIDQNCNGMADDLPLGGDYQGGKIAYVLKSGDPGYDANTPHGLIAAPSDQGSGIPWAPIAPFAFLGTSDALGTGAANTKKIVDYYGDGNYAAKLCADLVLNGHDDWYLPSLAELNILYVNRFAIGGFDTNTNDIPNSYWSSTESDYTSAWFKFFNFGYQTTVTKYDSYRHNVRAIRSF